MDIGSSAAPRALFPAEVAAAAARLDQIARTAAIISPKNLAELAEPPPQPYRELVIKAAVDRETFERHAWPVIANQVMTDPTITGEPIGFIYSVGAGERRLAVYFTETEGSQ